MNLTEIQLDQHEAAVMERRGDVALANGLAMEARRLFRIADALRVLPGARTPENFPVGRDN